MFRNHILMGVAHASNTRLLRQTAETAKFLAIIFLFLTQNVSRTCCSSNAIGYKSNDGYASWLATQTTGVVSGTVAAVTADDTHRLAKRMDLELCLSKYEIHKNTIIRTGESQTLGGKYLQGLELDTAEECQRLCCETESCDVYVFEDKSDGYCYLFECGPPENFHCKFTRHANYTSAVLTVARNVNEKTTAKPNVALAKGINSISQQEWELTSLKVKPEERYKIVSTAVGASGVESAASSLLVPGTATISGNANVVATTGPVPMLGVEQIPPISVAFPQKVYPVQCGRFQFPCHSGECIAVYNACDGIPQCEDGSDEGPECSGVTSTAKANADTVSTNILDPNGQKLPSEPQYQPSLPQQAIQQQQQQVMQQHQQSVQQTLPAIVPPSLGNREDAGAWANRKAAQSVGHATEKETNNVDLNGPNTSHKESIQVPTVGVNANNIPNSVLSNTYSNTNLNNNNNNNGNVNLNSAYNAAAMQRNGIYVPQMADVTNGGTYIRQQQQQQQMPPSQQQQQYPVPQGNLMMPSNAQWQLQQQQQLLQPVATPQRNQLPQQQQQQQQALPQQPYIINTAEQQQQPVQTEAKASLVNGAGINMIGKSSLQQQSQTAGPRQIIQQSAVHVASPSVPVKSQTTTVTQKPAAGQAGEVKAGVAEEYDDYDEDESTEPPKKKHKHKKPTSSTSKNDKKKAHMDPIELALVEQRQHAPAPQPVHEQYKLIHENLGLEFRDHDGQSERPGGAMLSLTLGLLVTAALGILIGCRMRTVGRRTRRMGGKVPYSHEADFLVNGMYL